MPIVISLSFCVLLFLNLVAFWYIILISTMLVDYALGEYSISHISSEMEFYFNDKYIHDIKFISAIVLIFVNIMTVFYVVTHTLQIADYVLIIIALGMINSNFTICLVHELLHEKNKFSQYIGSAMLITIMMPQFKFDHIFQHHHFVALPNDVSTAKKIKIYLFSY